MSLHLVTGRKGEAHITAEDHGAFNATIFGHGEGVLGIGKEFEALAITANTVRIYDGDLIMQGRHVRIPRDTYVDIPIENGTQGMNRNDLIVVRYTKDAETGYEKAEFVALQGTAIAGEAQDPTHTTGDILSEACLLHEMPLYRVKLAGITIESVELVADVIPDIKAQLDGKADKLPDVNVIEGTYGGFNTAGGYYNIPNVTVDRNGRVTKASNSVLKKVEKSDGNTPGLVTYNQLTEIRSRVGSSYVSGGDSYSTSIFIGDILDPGSNSSGTNVAPRILNVMVKPQGTDEWYPARYCVEYADGTTSMTTEGTSLNIGLPYDKESWYETYKNDTFIMWFDYCILYIADPDAEMSM